MLFGIIFLQIINTGHKMRIIALGIAHFHNPDVMWTLRQEKLEII